MRSVNGDGDGSRRIVVFSDPYCSYCKTLEHRLAGQPDATVYTFLYPILTPGSKTMAARIWCASNRTGPWSTWMLRIGRSRLLPHPAMQQRQCSHVT
nr:thioredoxin fold domain-containing protein [Mycetohabitans sp. B2]